MALTKEFVEAVSQGNLLRVKIMLKDSLLVDTSFRQFDEMLNYAESRINGIWVSDDEDDDVFSQSVEEFNAILAGLVNNFSKRRVTHLKGMINKLYPPHPKIKQDKREATVVTKGSSKALDEYNGIIKDKNTIIEVCSRIKNKNGMSITDLRELRDAAKSIVSHCDKIKESR